MKPPKKKPKPPKKLKPWPKDRQFPHERSGPGMSYPVPITDGEEELSLKEIALVRAYAADPTSDTYGVASRAARSIGMREDVARTVLKRPAVKRVIQVYLERHDAWVEQIEALVHTAGLEAAERLIEAVRQWGQQRPMTPKELLADEKGIPVEEVMLPDEGSPDWHRIHAAAAAHNRNYLQAYKIALDTAQNVLAHTIGHPAIKTEIQHRRDDSEDTELVKEIRRMPPAAQERLLDVIRASRDLLQKGGRLEPVEGREEEHGKDENPQDAS